MDKQVKFGRDKPTIDVGLRKVSILRELTVEDTWDLYISIP